MRQWFIGLLLVGLMASCSSKDEKSSISYVFHAGTGSFVNGKIVLRDVSPAVSFFENKEDALGGVIGMGVFVNQWKATDSEKLLSAKIFFKTDRILRLSNEAVEIRNPRYNAYEKTLTFDLPSNYGGKMGEVEEVYLLIQMPSFQQIKWVHSGYGGREWVPAGD